jgi:myosin heavy subunit
LVLEEQLEDRARLVDDLEEELRAQRALSADQADRLAHLQPPSAPPLAPAPHDAVLVAQLRAELADSQRALLDLSAEFHQSSQGMLWALQERDQHILQLRTSLHAWEQHGQRLEGELGARDLLLENLHQVLARQAAELDALRARPAGAGAGVVEATEDKGLARALRQELTQALDAAKQERAHAARAAVERERIREVMLQAREELVQRTLALGRAQQTLDAQEKQAVAFAEEVAGVYDERNRLKAALEKAQEELDKLNKVSKEAMDLSLNVDRELARRKDQLAALQREQVDLNIEKVNLEREVGQLLKRKNDADRRIAALEAELAQTQAELAQAQAALQAQDTRHQGELQGAQVLLAEREDALKRALRAMTAHERELGAKERELRAHQQRLAEQAEALGQLQAALDALQPAPAPAVVEAPAPTAPEAPAPAVEEKPKRVRAPKTKVEPVAAVEVVAEAPAPPPEDPAPAPAKPKRAPAKPKQPR